MHTFKDAESEDSTSSDLLHRAYGRKVQELLSQSDAGQWVEDLWEMYTGFTLFAQECGTDPRGHNGFVSFKNLVFFFQDLDRMNRSAEL